MKILKKIKNNRAVTLADVIIALAILILSTGILTTSYFTIAKHNALIRKDAEVLNYAITIMEGIDLMTYDEVDENINLNVKYNIPVDYELTLEVRDYNEQDIIKIVTLTIEYDVMDETKTYSVQKLKIKEI